MRLPSKEELPLRAPNIEMLIDQKKVDQFQKAFRSNISEVPPTLGAIGLQGVFKIVNELEVDWRHLLHATQSFEYHEAMKVPVEISAATQLLDVKTRAGMHWLQFLVEFTDLKTKRKLVSSRSLIMVKAT